MGWRVRVLTKRVGGATADEEELNGVQVSRIGPRGERSAAGKWRLVPAAIRWLIRHARDYDVVCAIDYRGVGLAALAARRSTGAPVVFQGQTTGVLVTERTPAVLERWGVAPDGWFRRAAKRPMTSLYRLADAF